VHFAWPETGGADEVRVEIYNLHGERLACVHEAINGQHSTTWQADGVAPGIYLYRLTLVSGGQAVLKKQGKLALIK
jgi:hypothetical protein